MYSFLKLESFSLLLILEPVFITYEETQKRIEAGDYSEELERFIYHHNIDEVDWLGNYIFTIHKYQVCKYANNIIEKKIYQIHI